MASSKLDDAGFRAGYYVRGEHFAPHKQAHAIARAEWLSWEQKQRIKVLHVAEHGGMARTFHHATGVRHK